MAGAVAGACMDRKALIEFTSISKLGSASVLPVQIIQRLKVLVYAAKHRQVPITTQHSTLCYTIDIPGIGLMNY